MSSGHIDSTAYAGCLTWSRAAFTCVRAMVLLMAAYSASHARLAPSSSSKRLSRSSLNAHDTMAAPPTCKRGQPQHSMVVTALTASWPGVQASAVKVPDHPAFLVYNALEGAVHRTPVHVLTRRRAMRRSMAIAARCGEVTQARAAAPTIAASPWSGIISTSHMRKQLPG